MRFLSSMSVVIACAGAAGMGSIQGFAQAKPATAHNASPAKRAPQAPRPTPPPPGTNVQGAATKAFLDRLNEYVSFHNNVEKMVPALKETASPAEISQREAALGATLIKQRPDAKEADFFIRQYQPYLRQLINADFALGSLVDLKALIVDLPKGL